MALLRIAACKTAVFTPLGIGHVVIEMASCCLAVSCTSESLNRCNIFTWQHSQPINSQWQPCILNDTLFQASILPYTRKHQALCRAECTCNVQSAIRCTCPNFPDMHVRQIAAMSAQNVMVSDTPGSRSLIPKGCLYVAINVVVQPLFLANSPARHQLCHQ